MTAEAAPDVQLEIGHVLFMDMVGYSQLLIDEQRELQQDLSEIVRSTDQFRAAEAADKLVRIPTGDGMALVFFNNLEAPMRCAIEIAQAAKEGARIRLRMGIHSGPVNVLADVNEQTNVAGAGINIAQRVMDCGDAGHILLAKRVAEDLAQSRQWRPHLHDLGKFGTKHGVKLSLVNFYTGEVGNAELPEKLKLAQQEKVATSEKSIAVLPFKNLSTGPERDYLGEGIAEEILTALSKIAGLRVAARRSSFWFKDRKADLKEIADKLNVEHVLEGSVRRDGNRVRISAELTDCCNGFTLWSETFEREMQGIFALQDEITRAIVDALKLKLDISSPLASRLVRSTAAYDVYLHGLFYSDRATEEDLHKSLEYFERALEKDPQFGRAWTGIAKAWLWLADAYVRPLEAYPKVREAALNALKIDKGDAEAHVYLAETKRILDWDLDGAEAEFNWAVEIEPNSTSSNYFIAAFWAARGERDDALIYLQRTSTIDPASLWVNNSASELYRYFGLYDEAMKAGERALQLDPAFVYGE